MKDQAQKLRELTSKINKDSYTSPLTESSNKKAKVIAITSGKGGVGKSNLAANLAINLSREGKKVALFDADLGLANIDVILGISPKYNLTHLVKGEKNINDILLEGPEGIKIIAGGSGVHELAQLSLEQIDKLTSSLALLEEEMDIILIDTGAGISHGVLNFALAAHEIIVVTIPEPTAIADAYGIIKSIYHYSSEAKVNLITNRVVNKNEAEQVAKRIDQVSVQFIGKQVTWMGYILEDAKVPLSVRSQKPFSLAYPHCLANQCLQRIAEKISNNCFNEEIKGEKKNFFQRLFTFWS